MCWVPCDALVLMYGTMHRVGCYRQLQQKFECHMCLDTLVTNVCSRKLQQATVHAKTAQAPTQHQFVFKKHAKSPVCSADSALHAGALSRRKKEGARLA